MSDLVQLTLLVYL